MIRNLDKITDVKRLKEIKDFHETKYHALKMRSKWQSNTTYAREIMDLAQEHKEAAKKADRRVIAVMAGDKDHDELSREREELLGLMIRESYKDPRWKVWKTQYDEKGILIDAILELGELENVR